MRIMKNKIEFPNGESIDIINSTEMPYRMDYILSMISDQITSALRHMNQPKFWQDTPETLLVSIKTADGAETALSIINADHNRVKVMLGNICMEETDEVVFANSFLNTIRNNMDELLSDFQEQKYVFSQLKADLRSDLNHLELAIDRYGF